MSRCAWVDMDPHLRPTSNRPTRVGPKRRVARLELIEWRGVSDRAEAVEKIHKIEHERLYDRYLGTTQVMLDDLEDTRLGFMYDSEGDLLGLVAAGYDSMFFNGRRVDVVEGRVLLRPGASGGVPACLFGLRYGLALKIRRPGRPLFYLTQAANPAAYSLLARHAARIYPRRDEPTPVWANELIRLINSERGFRVDGDKLLTVEAACRVVNDFRPLAKGTLAMDPEAQWFDSRVSWRDDAVLPLVIPLDLPNILASSLNLLASRRRRRKAERAT